MSVCSMGSHSIIERRLCADASYIDRTCLSLKLCRTLRVIPGATLTIQGVMAARSRLAVVMFYLGVI